MALVIDLKPNEKILIGDAVITNDKQRTRLHISGKSAIIRQKDVMKEEDANTPCKQAYFIIQCMYLARDAREYHEKYFELTKDIQHAAPSTSFMFLKINDFIIEGNYYKAMKQARELIQLEEDLLNDVTA